MDSTIIESLKSYFEKAYGRNTETKLLDDIYKKTHSNKTDLKNNFIFSTLVGLLITLIGMIVLIHLNLNIRRKEIAIRGLIGSSTVQTIWVIWKPLLYSYLSSFIIAIVIGVSIINQWLSNFPKRVSFNYVQLFIPLSSVSLLLVLVLVLIYHLFKIRSTDWLKYLRNE